MARCGGSQQIQGAPFREDVREHPRTQTRSDGVEPCEGLAVTAAKPFLHELKITSDGIVARVEEVGEGMTQSLFGFGQCVTVTLN